MEGTEASVVLQNRKVYREILKIVNMWKARDPEGVPTKSHFSEFPLRFKNESYTLGVL